MVRDPAGDFNRADVLAVETSVSQGRVIITIHYAGDPIGMAGGVGGTLSMDTDQNPSTGAPGTPGFDVSLVYNISRLAPAADLEILSGPGQGRTIPIRSGAGNGTRLEFNQRSVRFTFPAALAGIGTDFDYALFATGMFSAGDQWDRVPDTGVIRNSTGRPAAPPVTRGAAAPGQMIAEQTRQPGQPLVRQVNTRMEGDNLVWVIHTHVNLPVGQLDMHQSLHFHLLLDLDRSLATGITNGEIPFLAFGPDRVANCTLVPGGRGNIRITTAIKENGERQTVGGGAGSNDLNCTFERNRAKITIPAWLVKADSARLDWMLITTRLNAAPQVFNHSSIGFDTGQIRRPVSFPAGAVTIADPADDAIVATGRSEDGSVVRTVRQPGVPNVDIARITAARTADFVLMRITYETPIRLQSRYFTAITALTPGYPARQLLFSMNFSMEVGPQLVLRDMSRQNPDPTRAVFLNQCVVLQGRDAFVMIPVSAFGQGPLPHLDLVLKTHEMWFSRPASTSRIPGITVRQAPKQRQACLDQIPDKGFIRLAAP